MTSTVVLVSVIIVIMAFTHDSGLACLSSRGDYDEGYPLPPGTTLTPFFDPDTGIIIVGGGQTIPPK